MSSELGDPDDVALQTVPDYRNYLVYCDEASIHGGTRYYGWGTIWIPEEARGRLTSLFNRLTSQHFLSGREVKWKKVNAQTLPFFEALLDEFFQKSWVLFHCLIMDTRLIRTKLFRGGIQEARIRHLSAFLRSKIAFFSPPKSRKRYHLRVDPLPSSYPNEDEKLWKITNAMLSQTLGDKRIASLITRDSKSVRGIQLADFLLGAVLCPWNDDVQPDSPKAKISSLLYEYLGWTDHRADTLKEELKFNIWHFHDKQLGPRQVRARRVRLKHRIVIYKAT